MDILILSARPDYWAPYLPTFEQHGFQAGLADGLASAGGLMRQQRMRLVLVDLPHNYESLRQIMLDLRAIQPKVAIAMTSHLSTEGLRAEVADLDLFLPLQKHPDASDIKVLLDKLEQRAS